MCATQHSPTTIKYRGQAIIIVNENFYVNGVVAPELKREGAVSDLRKMTALFKALDFKVSPYKDLTGNQMKMKIQEACDDGRNMLSQCFALVISSHGEELNDKKTLQESYRLPKQVKIWRQFVYGSDGEPLRVRDIIRMFGSEDCLKNKPKFFFLQADRNRGRSVKGLTNLDKGVAITVAIDEKVSGTQASDAGDVTDTILMQFVDTLTGPSDNIYENWPEAGDQWTEHVESAMEVDSETTHAQDVTQEMLAEARLINQTGHTLSELQEAETTHAQGVTQETQAERENIVAQNFMVAETRTTQAEQPNNVSSMSSAQLVTSHEQNATGQVQQTSAVRQQRNIVTQSQTSGEGLGFDIIGITELPDDCLIVYPSMSGKAAFHDGVAGSRLFHSMFKPELVKILLNGGSILHYLTLVSKDLAAVDMIYGAGSYKSNTCIQHSLCNKEHTRFKPLTDNSLMANIIANFNKGTHT